MTTILHTRQLSVSYGGVKALIDVDLEVREGQLVGLIGPNGAGKTTCIDALTGFADATGSARMDGTELLGLSPPERARRGLARTWQASELFYDLTVREHLSLAAERPSGWALARELVTGRASPIDVDRPLEILGLERMGDRMPAELTTGQQKLVGVARAVAGSPRLVCLDEPAAGLDSGESAALGEHLRKLVDDGTSMLLVDHDMGLVLAVCDYVVVLEFGRVIGQGTPDAVRKDARVIQAYLGESAESEHYQDDIEILRSEVAS
jgi:branched-chain amino acid transport system ATP-binding protein